MFGDATDFILGMGVDTAGFSSGMTKANQKVDQFGQHVDKAGKKGKSFQDVLGFLGKGAAVAGVGVLAFGGMLIAAGKAAADEEAGIARLNTTLKNSIKGWDGNTQAVEAYIGKQQKLAFADDELRDSLAHLVGQTQDLAEAQNLQSLAMDLARAKNIDLEQATKLVGKVDMENIGVLKKLGIAIDENATKEEALAAIRSQTAGQAEAYANTAAGSWERVQNTLGNIFEDIGGKVLGLVAGPLADFADWLQSPEVQAGLDAIIDGIGVGLTGAFNFLKGVIDTVGPPVVGFFSGLFDAIGKIANGENPFRALGDWISGVSGQVGAALPNILAKLGEWGGAFLGWVVVDVLPKLPGELAKILSAVQGWITTAAADVGDRIKNEWAPAFWTWVSGPGGVLSDIDPKLDPVGAARDEWVTANAMPFGTHITKEWVPAFNSWISGPGGVLATMPGEQKKVEDGITLWMDNAQPGIFGHMADWPANFWNWITGPGGVLETMGPLLLGVGFAIWDWIGRTGHDIGEKWKEWGDAADYALFTGPDAIPHKITEGLAKVWNDFTKWISDTAAAIPSRARQIGGGLVDGIKSGIMNGWGAFTAWLTGMMGDLIAAILASVGIHSPSTVTAEIGRNMVAGLRQGWIEKWPDFALIATKSMGELIGPLGNASLMPVSAAGGGIGTPSAPSLGGAFRLGGGFGGGNRIEFKPTLTVYINDQLMDAEKVSIQLESYRTSTTPKTRW